MVNNKYRGFKRGELVMLTSPRFSFSNETGVSQGIEPAFNKTWLAPKRVVEELKDIAMKYNVSVLVPSMSRPPDYIVDYIIGKTAGPTDLIFSMRANPCKDVAWGGPMTQEQANQILENVKKEEKEKLDGRYLIVGTKVTMKASGASAEISDVTTGRAKLKINGCESDWMNNSDIQKEIKETL